MSDILLKGTPSEKKDMISWKQPPVPQAFQNALKVVRKTLREITEKVTKKEKGNTIYLF